MTTDYTRSALNEEAAIIDAEFKDLMAGYLSSNHRKKVEIIERAFKFARKAHAGVRRRSGEPYILHPIAVAKIVSREMGLGSTSICAALLHDVVEDTDYTVEDIEQQFGTKIAQLVSGLTKISGGIFGDKASAQAENFRKLLLTMSEDIRVVLIKMADRLHNMRTLGSMAVNKQYKIAGETLYIYAPLAHRLGLYTIKTELEDLSFKYEHPEAYTQIARNIADTEEHRLNVFRDFISPVEEKLREQGITYEAKARVKSIYSIWRKMEKKHVPFEEVYDLYAVRIIFDCDDRADEKRICWAIYGAITDLYRLHPDRVRDWVVNPKANGYQALHLTVMGSDGNWVEVQIRSRRMDEIAEKGFAAHWKYKIGEGDEESELTVWLRTIKDILDDPTPNALDFLDTLKLNLFASEIVVFTPKGELITLPNGATVLDMAFELHSQIGTHCIAGKVNHKLVPLSHKLQSGDQVEVLTSQSQKPKEEWLGIVTSARALTTLRQALRREQQPVIEEGKRILRQYLEEGEVELNNQVLTKVTGYFKLSNPEQLYLKLGRGEVTLDNYVLKDSPKTSPGLLKKIFRIGTGRRQETESETETTAAPPVDSKEVYMLRYGDSGRNFVLCDCCNPIPGDDVMGFINDQGRVEVHALSCPRASVLKAGYGPRIVATQWTLIDHTFPARILVKGIDRHGILQEITLLLATTPDIDLRNLHVDTDNEVFNCQFTILVRDNSAVNSLCSRMKKIKDVKSAVRVKD